MITYKHLYSFLFLLVMISSCKVSKDAQPPQLASPGAYSNKKDSSNIAEIGWKDFFTDPTFQKLIDSALVKNYDMQFALKNMESAQLLFKQVKWNYAPELNLNILSTINRPSENSLTGVSLKNFGLGHSLGNYSADVSLAWEADIWGKIRNQKRGALATYLQSNEVKKAVQTTLIVTISKGYYNLLLLDAQLKIAQKNAALSDSTIAIIKLQYASGLVTSLAVEQAQAQQLSSELLIPQFEKNIALQQNALKILTGEFPAKIARSTSLQEVKFNDSLSVGIPSQLLSNRPDLKNRELELTKANANVGINKASMYPALRITADAGLNSFKLSNWLNIPGSLFGIVGGSVVQPLLQHKLLKTRYKVALIEKDKATIQFKQSFLIAFGEVSDALITLEKLNVEQRIAAQRMETLQRAVSNASLLFKNGMANYLEVITAQSNALQSELEFTTIYKARLDATAQLYKSLGGGWK